MVTIIHQNADISMSGVGVSCSSTIGGCVSSEGDVCGCAGTGGEAA